MCVRACVCVRSLGKAPPERIIIEYDPKDVETYIEIADAIEAAFPSVIVEGNETGDGREGSFEVLTSDGYAVYSKLQKQSFPDPDLLVELIATRSARKPGEGASDGPVCG